MGSLSSLSLGVLDPAAGLDQLQITSSYRTVPATSINAPPWKSVLDTLAVHDWDCNFLLVVSGSRLRTCANHKGWRRRSPRTSVSWGMRVPHPFAPYATDAARKHFMHKGCPGSASTAFPDLPKRHPQAVTQSPGSWVGGPLATMWRFSCPRQWLLTSSRSSSGGSGGCSSSAAASSEPDDDDDDEERTSCGH